MEEAGYVGVLLILSFIVLVVIAIKYEQSMTRKQLATEFCIDRGNGVYEIYIHSFGNPIKDGSADRTLEDALDKFLNEHQNLKIMHIEKRRDGKYLFITDSK